MKVALVRRSLAYYWRTNLAVIGGVGAAVAVLAGALLVGDSVRSSLRDLFLQRIGRTDFVVSSTGFFLEQLTLGESCPLISLQGVVTHEQSGRRATGVQVYGVDERFWRFHGVEREGPAGRSIFMSPGLVQELASRAGDSILLRVEKPSAIPLESVHGRKEDVGRTIRFTAREALPSSSLGEFSIRPQQGSVRVVFVPLKRLQADLEQNGKVNTLLVSGAFSPETLKERFALEDLGIRIRVLPGPRCLSFETGGALISDALSEAAMTTAKALNMRTSSIFTYLANTIRLGEREIPYSLVTAKDGNSSGILLNEWAGRDLGAKTGDEVALDYYVWEANGRLVTRTANFRVNGILPLAGDFADRDLAPEYPGITGSESLHDWDPPFPIDLRRIRPRDEEYWKRYRTTPKALIPIEKGQELWGSRFGKLTSIRIFPRQDTSLEAARDVYAKQLRSTLDPVQAGFSVYAARSQGLGAAGGSTDFGEYFVYFSFFLLVSALLLTGLFFKLGLEQRLGEIGLLQAVGFPAGRIRTLFLSEGAVLAGIGSILGLAGAVVYASGILLGLRTWWVGAVGTRLLSLHVTPMPLALGALGGVIAALVSIAWTLRGLRQVTPRNLQSNVLPTSKGRGAGVIGGIATLLGVALLLAASLNRVSQTAGFFGAGSLLLMAALCYQWVWLSGNRRSFVDSVAALGFRSARYRPGRSILSIALIASATFLIVAIGAFRQEERSSLDPKSGTGGFPLFAESLLPLVHDPNSPAGKDALNLPALKEVRFVPFRLRPGDDASCLNLYQPRNPRILAAPPSFLKTGRFSFQDSLAKTDQEKDNPWLLLETQSSDGWIPAIADSTSMAYALHRKLGDELIVAGDGGRPIRLRLIGALRDSLFQGELLISERNFLRVFPDQEGFRFFLLDAPREEALRITGVLEEALSDYGFDVIPAGERLAAYHRVENTYLSTFQALGALGLLLGTVGLAAVLLRNILERRRELALLRAVGYRSTHLAWMIVAENTLLLGSGLLTGTVCALLAIAPAFFSRGGPLPVLSLGLLLSAVLLTGLLTSLLATRAAVRSPLLPAFRAE